MKKILIFLLLLNSICGITQSIDEIHQDFWKAVDKGNNPIIIEKGEQLFVYIEKDSIEIDSSIIEIRLLTALAYSNIGNHIRSLDLNLQTLEIRENVFGKKHAYQAQCLNNIANNYLDQGNYYSSLEYNLLALKIKKKTVGKKNISYATSLNNIALNYSKLGDYTKALECNLLALEIKKKALGKEHPKYATSLNNIAVNYLKLGDYNKALEYNLIALEIRKKSLGKEHQDYAQSLNNIAFNYLKLGDFKKALEYNLSVLVIQEKISGKEHQDYLACLNNISENYIDIGEYNKALEYILKALKICKKTLGEVHPDYATNLNNTAMIYSYLGEKNKALEYNLLALSIREKVLGKEHPDYASSLNNISSIYFSQGEYDKALEYGFLALESREKTVGKGHPDYAISLNNLSLNYSNLGNFNKALEYNLLALEINEKIYGKEHPEYAKSLAHIAKNHSELAEYSKALEYNLLALKINEQSFGKEHPTYGSNLCAISCDYFKISDFNKALDFLTQSLEISIHSFTKNKFGLTPEIKFSFKQKVELYIQLLASLSSIENSKIETLHNNWITINGIIGSNQDQLKRKIELSNNNELIKLFDELTKYQFKLSSYTNLTKIEKKQNESNLILLENQITELQSKLNKYSLDFSELNRTFTSRDVTNKLKDKEVLVNIMCFPYYDFKSNDWSDSKKYLVFISNSKTTIADYIYIQKGNDLEELIFRDYKNQATKFDDKTELKDSNFYNYFWKPIADKIGNAETIYVSLGGVYNNINLNTLYNQETGKYLIEEKDIRIVNSARDFVLSKERQKKIFTSTIASLYGFPDFNGNTTISVDTLDYLTSERNLSQEWIDRLTRGNMKASPLPATKIEIENISSTFNKNGWNVSSYSGSEASETNLKKEKSPRVLHIATHGYFFEDIPLDTISNRFFGMDRNQMIQNPMLRSGLLFKGANRTLKGEKSIGENGLLSATEASLLDLRETELVVLSACETGKGEVKNSEGVYGLRKAFSDAGAQNIIMSLWKVDDEVTQEFMTLFYEIWLNKKTSIREAFNKTQLEIKAKYPQPYYWGAFILVGE